MQFELEQKIQSHYQCIGFSRDGKYMACCNYTESGIIIHNLKDNSVSKVSESIGKTNRLCSLCFSSDNRFVCTGSYDDDVYVWDIQTGKLTAKLTGHTNTINSVCFSPDGQFICRGSRDGTIRVWDVSRPIPICISTYTDHTKPVNSVCFSPNGLLICSGSSDHMVQIWDVQTEKCLATLVGHTGGVYEVCFSPDGRFICSGSDDKTVRIWDTYTGKCLAVLPHNEYVYMVCYSHDGRFVCSGTGDYKVHIWDVQTEKCVYTLLGHTYTTRALCYSPDDQCLYSGSAYDFIKWRKLQKDEILKNECKDQENLLQKYYENMEKLKAETDIVIFQIEKCKKRLAEKQKELDEYIAPVTITKKEWEQVWEIAKKA